MEAKPFMQWLEDCFLGYLEEWEESVKKRDGYSASERKRMLLSDATRLGLKLTSKLE
jgi:hypothetical protein